MKRLGILGAGVLVLCAMSSPALALFVNGGFETGDLTGWTLVSNDATRTAVITAGSMQPGQTLPINPYNGTYMARLQDYTGLIHVSTLSQNATVTQDDLNSGDQLFINWGTILVDPDSHHGDLPPKFRIEVFKNGIVQNSYTADASNHNVDPSWVDAGFFTFNGGGYGGTGIGWYKHDTYVYDFSSFNVGDVMRIEMTAWDCGYGGHGGWAYLDGIGTTYQPPEVPEPGTVLLVAIAGVIGLVGVARRRSRS